MFTTLFVQDAIERAVRTFAQALLSVLVVSTGLDSVNWTEVLGVAGLAALISVLTSVAGGARTGTAAVYKPEADDVITEAEISDAGATTEPDRPLPTDIPKDWA